MLRCSFGLFWVWRSFELGSNERKKIFNVTSTFPRKYKHSKSVEDGKRLFHRFPDEVLKVGVDLEQGVAVRREEGLAPLHALPDHCGLIRQLSSYLEYYGNLFVQGELTGLNRK